MDKINESVMMGERETPNKPMKLEKEETVNTIEEENEKEGEEDGDYETSEGSVGTEEILHLLLFIEY